MQTLGTKNEIRDADVAGAPREVRRTRWRPWLRAVHRDVGYLAVGLTIVYAASGLAVNHLADWDPNFQNGVTIREIGVALPQDDAAFGKEVLARLGIAEKPLDVYRASDDRVDIKLARAMIHVDPRTGHVVEESQRPRFFFRAINWLHLNRGKKAWTFIADAYAAGLLLLALSGLLMIAGKKGLIFRGLVLAGLGCSVPIAYVVLSGP